MPSEQKNPNIFLIVASSVVALIAIILAIYYIFIFTNQNKKTSALPVGGASFDVVSAGSYLGQLKQTAPDINGAYQKVTVTGVSEGAIQQLDKVTKIINGVTYQYLIGLLNQQDESVPLYITQEEYDSITVFDSRADNRVLVPFSTLAGKQYIRVTRSLDLLSKPPKSSISIEILK